jgi:hypothetical protein
MEFVQRYHSRDAHDDDPKDGSLFNSARYRTGIRTALAFE